MANKVRRNFSLEPETVKMIEEMASDNSTMSRLIDDLVAYGYNFFSRGKKKTLDDLAKMKKTRKP